jgi:hypothetical protein
MTFRVLIVAMTTQHTTGRACGQASKALGNMQDKSTTDTVRYNGILITTENAYQVCYPREMPKHTGSS